MQDSEESAEARKVAKVAATKYGIELFREILRYYPVADIEDYWRNGTWKNDKLKVDLVLTAAHKREAGAPEPPPLEDIPMPQLPNQKVFSIDGRGIPIDSRGRPIMNAVAKPEGAPAVASPLVPSPISGLPSMGTNLVVSDLRAMTVFVAKWKMDLTRTKPALAKLSSAMRRQVLENFSTELTGLLANDALDQYISSLEVQDLGTAAGSGTLPSPVGFTKAAGLPITSKAPAPSPESQIVTLFAAKFKLDPTGTKILLSGLPFLKRRHVIDKFSTDAVGAEAMDALSVFITEAAEMDMEDCIKSAQDCLGDLNGGNGGEIENKRPLADTGVMENGDAKRRMMGEFVGSVKAAPPAADFKRPNPAWTDMKRPPATPPVFKMPSAPHPHVKRPGALQPGGLMPQGPVIVPPKPKFAAPQASS